MNSSRCAAALLALAGLAACTDDLPLQTAPTSAPRGNAYTQPSEWRGYWHHDGELFVYDSRPQVGLNTSFHGDFRMNQVAAANARIVRTHIFHNDESSYPGHAAYAIGVARSRGMEMMFQVEELTGIPPLIHTPAADSAYRRVQIYEPLRDRMVQMMDANYGGIRGNYKEAIFWQIGNEPDAGCDAGVAYNGTTITDRGSLYSSHDVPNRYAQGWNYAQMLKVVYPAVKAKARSQGREVFIVTAGLTGEEEVNVQYGPPFTCGARSASTVLSDPNYGDESWEFLRGIYAGGGAPFFDILAIHAYGQTAGGRNSLTSTTSVVHGMLYGELGDANRPLWITEMGTSAANNKYQLLADGPSNDAAQADQIQNQWYSDALSFLNGSGMVSVMMPYTLWTEEGGNPAGTGLASADPADYGLGITRRDTTQLRPAYTTMVNSAPARVAGNSGSFRIAVYGRVPSSHLYQYDGTDAVVMHGLSLQAPAPATVPFFIPTVFNVFQGSAWSPNGFNNIERGVLGGGGITGFRATNGQFADPVNGIAPNPAVSVCYSAVFDPGGAWEQDQCNGAPVGGPGETRTAQAIRMNIVDPLQRGWSVCYTAHIAGTGWVYPEACDGGNAGYLGASIDAVRIRFVRQHL